MCSTIMPLSMQVCKICRHSLHEESNAKPAALKKTKKRKRPDVEQAAEKGKDQESQDASDEVWHAPQTLPILLDIASRELTSAPCI